MYFVQSSEQVLQLRKHISVVACPIAVSYTHLKKDCSFIASEIIFNFFIECACALLNSEWPRGLNRAYTVSYTHLIEHENKSILKKGCSL